MENIEVTLRRLLKMLDNSRATEGEANQLDATEREVVDRLLLGVGRLAHSVHQRMNRLQDNLMDALLRQYLPGLLQPVPAMMLMSLMPDMSQCSAMTVVPAGSVIHSQEGGPTYSVKTMREKKLYPFELLSIGIAYNNHYQLQCRFLLSDLVNLNQCSFQPLSLLICSPYVISCEWYYALLTQVSYVQVSWCVNELEKAVTLPAIIRSTDIFYSKNQGLSQVLYDLNRHIAIPASSLSIDVMGLGSINWPEHLSSWTLTFAFNSPTIQTRRLPAPQFKINMVPVMQLQPIYADPIKLNKNQVIYPLSFSQIVDNQVIYAIDRVESTNMKTGEKTLYVDQKKYIECSNRLGYSLINNVLYPTKQGSIFLENVKDNELLSIEASVLYIDHEDELSDVLLWHLCDFSYVDVECFGFIAPARKALLNEDEPSKENVLSISFHSLLNKQALASFFILICDKNNLIHQHVASMVDCSYRCGREFINQSLFDVVTISFKLKAAFFSGEAEAYFFAKFLHQLYEILSPINTYVTLNVMYLLSPSPVCWVLNSYVDGEVV